MFKVGDRVRVTAKNAYAIRTIPSVRVGSFATVTEAVPDRLPYPYRVRFDGFAGDPINDIEFLVAEDEIEATE